MGRIPLKAHTERDWCVYHETEDDYYDGYYPDCWFGFHNLGPHVVSGACKPP